MSLTPADVRNKRFGMTRFRGGYIDLEVDAFLDAIEATLDEMTRENEELRAELAAVVRGGIPRVPLPRGSLPAPGGGLAVGLAGAVGGRVRELVTAADVRNKHFGVTRIHSGYVDEEVDEFLIEVETELDRLDRENAELRARLVEYARSWEKDPERFSVGMASVAGASAADIPAADMPAGQVAVPGYGAVARATPGYEAVPGQRRSAPSPQRRHWMEADMPTAVPLYAEIGLSIHVCSDPSSFVGSQSRGILVTLVAQTRFELAATSALQQSVLVPESGGKSDTVRFTFHATYPGQYGVRVSAFTGGTFLGDLTAELSVERSGRLIRGAVQTAELAEMRPAPGEVTLHIRNDGAQYIFQFMSELSPMEPVIAGELTGRSLEPRQRIAEALGAGNAGHNVRSALEQAGAGLWFDMVPDLVKEQFWHLRDSITAFSVLSEQDIIPWELLYPLARGESSGFLAEQFPVLRRIAGHRPLRHISTGPPLYVVPPETASHAGQAGRSGQSRPAGQAGQAETGLEISALRRRLGPGAGDVDDMDRLLDVIDAGDFGVLHFACHDNFRPDTGGSSVVLGGGRLIPAFLNPAVVSKSLVGRRPLVFLNSSRSATMVPEYTKLAGWAEQFIAAGAVAFVGASWPVSPASATAFADAFYGALQEGQPLGAAASAARKAAAVDLSEPSWLAYSVYGDAAASVHG